MAELLEACMIAAFGLSWPANILKSWKVRTTKGKSLLFLGFVLAGYLCGILAKLISGVLTYVLVFYVINFFMVALDLVVYFRNLRLERQAGRTGQGP